MQDSNIKYQIDVVGAEQAVSKLQSVGAAALRANSTVNSTAKAASSNAASMDNMAGGTNRAAAATDRASKSQASYFGHIAKTTVQSALINKLFLELVDVSGQAVQQVDLMNNFPATMASLGQSTAASTEAFSKLRDYVGMVGGNLGDATSAVTRFTGVTKDVKSAVAIYTGLNNALVAGDSSLQEQRQAAIQFAQAFERGKPDMKEWLSLTQNMSTQLGTVAKSMGYVNGAALGEALRNGDESMANFTTKLTELSTGTGPIAQQALARMQGMQFAFNVMKNTMVQGLASIINAFGRTNIVSFFSFLTQVIQVLSQAVVFLINAFFGLINAIRGLFGLNPLEGMKKDAQGVADGIGAGAGAAGDLGDGLKGAKKDAKELNKSLASFDKMNVLPDKTSGKDKEDDPAGGGTQFDQGQLDKLGGLFDGMAASLKDVSIWAKIVAGIIGGILATMLALNRIEAFNNMIENVKTFKKNVDDANKKLGEMADKSKTAFGKVGEGIGGALGKSGGLVTSFIGGLLGGIGAALAPALAPIGTAIVTFVAGLSAVTIGLVVLAIAVIVGIIWLIATNWEKITKFIGEVWANVTKFIGDTAKNLGDFFTTLWEGIKLVFKTAWDIIVAYNVIALAIIIAIFQPLIDFFAGLWNGIVAIFSVVGKWFGDKFKEGWDAVVAIWTMTKQYFSDRWNEVVAVFSVVGQWFGDRFKEAWDAIVLVFSVVGQWFNDNVWQKLVNLFSPIVEFFRSKFDLAWKGVTLIWTVASQWFNGNVWQPITGVFSTVGKFFSDKFNEAWTLAKNVFNNVGGWFRDNVVNPIAGAFSGIGATIANVFKGVINGIIDLINGFIRTVNTNIQKINSAIGTHVGSIPSIPRLAKGGIVEQATVAMIGESGKEAVVPLENNTEWMDTLAAKIGNMGGGGNQPIHLTVQVGEEKIATKMIDLINDRTQMSGRNTILI